MLSLERCREILGEDCGLSDEELEELRFRVYAFADIVLQIAREKQDGGFRWSRRRKRWEKR